MATSYHTCGRRLGLPSNGNVKAGVSRTRSAMPVVKEKKGVPIGSGRPGRPPLRRLGAAGMKLEREAQAELDGANGLKPVWGAVLAVNSQRATIFLGCAVGV